MTDFCPKLGSVCQMLTQTVVLATTTDLQAQLNRIKGAIFVKYSKYFTFISIAVRYEEWQEAEQLVKKILWANSCGTMLIKIKRSIKIN